MDLPTKVAYIGGGSRFVPSIVHGIAESIKKKGLYDVNICLYDINRERAEYITRYCRLLSTSPTPIKIDVVRSQYEALERADLVFASIGLWDDIGKVNQALDAVNAHLPETGPDDTYGTGHPRCSQAQRIHRRPGKRHIGHAPPQLNNLNSPPSLQLEFDKADPWQGGLYVQIKSGDELTLPGTPDRIKVVRGTSFVMKSSKETVPLKSG